MNKSCKSYDLWDSTNFLGVESINLTNNEHENEHRMQLPSPSVPPLEPPDIDNLLTRMNGKDFILPSLNKLNWRALKCHSHSTS